MNILVACEYSGRVRDALIANGHRAISCDLLPTDVPGPHYQGDVLDILYLDWDMLIAHPPCTYLSNSGVRWLHTQKGRWKLMEEGAKFFNTLYNADHIPLIAIENPVMHGYAQAIINGVMSFTVQPWQFGDNFKKRTCFWTKGLPKLIPTSKLDGTTAVPETHMTAPGPDRWKKRSTTYPGIAKAIADQWAGKINES